jgi:hypothetical protein
MGMVALAVVAPEFGWLPRFWVWFYSVAPFVPVLFVWYGAGRRPLVESIGWGFLVVELLFVLSF